MKFKPGKGKILVKLKEIEKVNAKGIIIPTDENKRSNEGVVVAIGGEVSEYAVGDNVLFGNGSGVSIEIEGETFLLMVEREVYGTL